MKKCLILLILMAFTIWGCTEKENLTVNVENIIVNDDTVKFIVNINDPKRTINKINVVVTDNDQEYYKQGFLISEIKFYEEITFENLTYDKTYTIEIIDDNQVKLFSTNFTIPNFIQPTFKILNPNFLKGIFTFDLQVDDPNKILKKININLVQKQATLYDTIISSVDKPTYIINDISLGSTIARGNFINQDSKFTIEIFGQYQWEYQGFTKFYEEDFWVGKWIERPSANISGLHLIDRYLCFDIYLNDPHDLIQGYTIIINDDVNEQTISYPNIDNEKVCIKVDNDINLDAIKSLAVYGNYIYNGRNYTCFLDGKGLEGSIVAIDNNIYFKNIYHGNKLYKYDIKTKQLKSVTSSLVDKLKIINGEIYYNDPYENENIYRLNTDDRGSVILEETVRDFFFNYDVVYYIDYYYNIKSKFRFPFDPKEKTLYHQENHIISNLLILQNQLYFLDNNYLYKMNLDGTGVIRLTDNKVGNFIIENNIIYYQLISDVNALACINVDGSNEQILTSCNPKSITYHNNKLYYYNDENSSYGIYEYNLDTNKQILIHKSVANNIKVVDDNIFYYKSSSHDLIKGDCHLYCYNMSNHDEFIINYPYV